MIGQREALRLVGCTVFDPRGQRLGIVGQMFVDDHTEQPEWVTVQTGLYGTNESFVPLAGATFDGDTLMVAVSKSTVRVAPRVELRQGDLPPEQEQALYRHYGTSSGVPPPRREEPVEREYAAEVQSRLRNGVPVR